MTTKQKTVGTENADVKKDIKETNKVVASQVISGLHGKCFSKRQKGLVYETSEILAHQTRQNRELDLHL